MDSIMLDVIIENICNKNDLIKQKYETNIQKIKEKIIEIEHKDHRFISMDTMIFCAKPYYVAEYGYFDATHLRYYDGINYTIMCFEDKNGNIQKLIIDDRLNIICKSLSKIRYCDKIVKNTKEYQLYQIVKHKILPVLQENDININVHSLYILCRDLNIKPIELAWQIIDGIRAIRYQFDTYSDYTNDFGEDLIQELTKQNPLCQFDAVKYITDISVSYQNASEMDFVAQNVYKELQNSYQLPIN